MTRRLLFFAIHLSLIAVIVVSKQFLNADVSGKVSSLRNAGKTQLKSKKFDEAIKYYSAALQLVEGQKGEFAEEMRRLCGLTLAECELQNGRWSCAVARCSDFIGEHGDLDHSSAKTADVSGKAGKDILSKALATAHYRRAKALQHLNKLQFAQIDLRRSLSFQPKDRKVLKEYKTLQNKLKKRSQSSLEGDGTDVEQKFQDFVEDCQCNHPRLTFSPQQIATLSRIDSPLTKRKFPALNNLGLGNSQSLGDPLSRLGGVDTMARTLSLMTGANEKSIRRALKTMQFVNKVYQKGKKIWEFLSLHKERILLVATVMWLLSTLAKHYWSAILPELLTLRNIVLENLKTIYRSKFRPQM